MESSPVLAAFLRRLLGLTVAGAVLLLFAGPILTVLCTAALCASVGFLVWLPMHTLFFGRDCPWHSVCAGGKRCRERLERRLMVARQNCMALAHRLPKMLTTWLAALGGALVEIGCGAAIGMLAAALADAEGPVVGLAGLLGAAAGASLLFSRKRSS